MLERLIVINNPEMPIYPFIDMQILSLWRFSCIVTVVISEGQRSQ